MPLKVSGMIAQSGRRIGAVSRRTTQTARPITGTMSSSAGNFRFAVTLAPIATIRISATMPSDGQSICKPRGASFSDRRIAVLLDRGRNAEDEERRSGGDIGLDHAAAG